jgi:hypothetical protein
MPLESDRGDLPAVWKQNVAEEIIRSTTNHTAAPGKHTLKLYATEIGFVTEKIVIQTVVGATASSSLGPPESVIV